MVDSTRVFFIGDSFVQGVGDPEYRGWVGRVLQASSASGEDLTGFKQRGTALIPAPPGTTVWRHSS